MSEPRPPRWSEEDLLELLLEGREEELARARADSDAARTLAELESFLARWREPLTRVGDQPSSELVGRRLARRVLSRTTRQDPGWRGDLDVIGRFVRDRLAASPLLRLAAAVLLMQFFALPLLAWMIWRAPERPDVWIRIEPEDVEPFLPPVVEDPLATAELDLPVGLREELRTARTFPQPTAVEVQGALRSASRALREAGWPQALFEEGPGDSPVRALLAARVRLAADAGATASELAPQVLAADGTAGGLERALRAELYLDLLALTGEAPEGLERVLALLGSDAREPGATRRLEALAIERARACGRADRTAWIRLADAGVEPGSRSPDPLDAGWKAALRAALSAAPGTQAALLEGSVGAWLGAPESER